MRAYVYTRMATVATVGYDSSLASGDNFGTNSLDPDQARKSVELNWIHTV